MERVFLVHGWSVKETTTYQALHLKLAQNGYKLENVYLGRYVSLDNEITVEDIAKALQNELVRKLEGDWTSPFHIITHSTGALVVKQWIVQYYKGKYCKNKPLNNLVFLAGPHFGSRLAHHGRSMLAHVKELGDTGRKILNQLELGSEFSWDINEAWLNRSNWETKGIRPFCLIGDRVVKSFADRLISRVFSAAFERGSDMVVRAAAGNLNFKRFRIHFENVQQTRAINIFNTGSELSGIAFGSLYKYTHSGPDNGIMNNIKKAADPKNPRYENLKLIIECLAVNTPEQYIKATKTLLNSTKTTAVKRSQFAQLDFKFIDEDDKPINDYKFMLGYLEDGKIKPSSMVANTHKNLVNPNHLTVFLDLKHIDPKRSYWMFFDASTDTTLTSYEPDPLKVKLSKSDLNKIITANQTTQIEVVLAKKSHPNLFVFHKGDDKNLPVKWNRKGEIIN